MTEEHTINFSNSTDRELLANMAPRLETVEKAVDKQIGLQDENEHRFDALERAITDVRQDLNETESRLSQRIDQRFDSVDDHLSAQDTRLDKVIGEKHSWSEKYTSAFLISAGVLLMILLEVGHTFKWF